MAEKGLTTFDHLSSAAASLNKATDELKEVVGSLDDALSRLNIGIPVWVQVVRWDDPENNGPYEREDLGFSKIDSIWRIGIRRVFGHDEDPTAITVKDIWWFNDAPRDLRLRAVEKLPLLLDALAKSATETAALVNKKLSETKIFAIGSGLLKVPK